MHTADGVPARRSACWDRITRPKHSFVRPAGRRAPTRNVKMHRTYGWLDWYQRP